MATRVPGAAEHRSATLLGSLRRLGSTLVATLHSRAELLSYEIARERVRMTRLAVMGIIALFFFFLGLVTATIFVIVLFWESQRLVVIGFLTLLYLGIAGGLVLYAKREIAGAKRPFSATVEQLKRDREHLSRRDKTQR